LELLEKLTLLVVYSNSSYSHNLKQQYQDIYKIRSVLNFTRPQEVSAGTFATTTKIADLFPVGKAGTDNKTLP
jgi:hypothetical protein